VQRLLRRFGPVHPVYRHRSRRPQLRPLIDAGAPLRLGHRTRNRHDERNRGIDPLLRPPLGRVEDALAIRLADGVADAWDVGPDGADIRVRVEGLAGLVRDLGTPALGAERVVA